MNRNGTNELISGDKPFIAILSNLRCLFTRLEPETFNLFSGFFTLMMEIFETIVYMLQCIFLSMGVA